MTKIDTSSFKKSRTTRTIPYFLALSAAFVACGVSYGAKPYPALNATACTGISGAWATLPSPTCTIAPGSFGVVSSDLRIVNGVKLDIQGGLTIKRGATVSNAGTIIVENAGGVAPVPPFHDWETGVLVFGTLDNSGSLTVANVYDATNATPQGTEGITVSFAVGGSQSDPSTYVVTAGALINSGTITVQNTARTRGIKNIGAFVNATSGTIIVANSGTSSVGIYDRREKLSSDNQFYAVGTLTNDGNIAIQSSGDSNGGLQYGYGIYSVSFFTNSASGTLTINPSPVDDDAGGFYNKGSFTNFGTFINNRGNIDEVDITKSTWGSVNELSGTMINYGTTNAGTITPGTGTFYNDSLMVNLGRITSHGVFVDVSYGSNGSTMINYGTFFNYGLIGGGVNKGVCIDEPATDTSPAGGGCG